MRDLRRVVVGVCVGFGSVVPAFGGSVDGEVDSELRFEVDSWVDSWVEVSGDPCVDVDPVVLTVGGVVATDDVSSGAPELVVPELVGFEVAVFELVVVGLVSAVVAEELEGPTVTGVVSAGPLVEPEVVDPGVPGPPPARGSVVSGTSVVDGAPADVVPPAVVGRPVVVDVGAVVSVAVAAVVPVAVVLVAAVVLVSAVVPVAVVVVVAPADASTALRAAGAATMSVVDPGSPESSDFLGALVTVLVGPVLAAGGAATTIGAGVTPTSGAAGAVWVSGVSPVASATASCTGLPARPPLISASCWLGAGAGTTSSSSGGAAAAGGVVGVRPGAPPAPDPLVEAVFVAAQPPANAAAPRTTMPDAISARGRRGCRECAPRGARTRTAITIAAATSSMRIAIPIAHRCDIAPPVTDPIVLLIGRRGSLWVSAAR